MAKKKQQQKDYTAEIQKSFDRWDHLNVHGGSDPTWTDGVNMNLVRNHILYGKREIEENMTPLLYPEIYYRDTPPEVDRDYMARADEIRVNAKRSLEAYKVDPDYQYLFRIVTHMTERQTACSAGKLSNSLTIGPTLTVNLLEHFITRTFHQLKQLHKKCPWMNTK